MGDVFAAAPAGACAAPHAGAPTAYRAFASAVADLDIEFDGDDRPGLITALLCACLEPHPEAGEVWRWSVDRRLRALLGLLRATAGRSATLAVRCGEETCGKAIELDIDLDALVGSGDSGGVSAWSTSIDGRALRLRLATGDDQRRWRSHPGDEDLLRSIAGDLVSALDGKAPLPHWRMPEDWLPRVEAELAAHDPLGALVLPLACPWCGTEQHAAPDLEAWALEQLAASQRRVLEQVHRLARVYHWSEAQVLALPPRRRAWYLARNAEGIEA